MLLRLQDCAAFGYSSGTVHTTPSMEREKIHASSDYQQASFADVAQPEVAAPRDASLLTQPGIFQADVAQGTEDAERLVRIEGCQVITPPVVQRTEKKVCWGT